MIRALHALANISGATTIGRTQMAPERSPAAVLTLIAGLVQRPRRKDRRLPLICRAETTDGSWATAHIATGNIA
ncbi:MAG: hypothetical protein ACRDRR_19890 [Pseudonocardiaceae bacterium]